MGVGLAAPIIAGLYMIYGPLGKKYTMPDPQLENDLECQVLELNQKVILNRPVWIGGLFDFWDDLTVACLSLFCTCCVFGWNMERLGFGNMYVHIFTFLLLCMAPFWVFNVSALMINDEALRYSVGITGILLSFLGLLYGGYWRTQMRKRFRLPSNPFCYGYAGLSDFVRWLFCSSCALAQEVRTGNFYEIEEGELCSRERIEEETDGLKSVLAPLERERSTITVPAIAIPVLLKIGDSSMSENI
jgi:Cys-rich protein (TIGR01571 family)